jgi:putative membrane protein
MMNPGGLAWSGALAMVLLLVFVVLVGLILARALLPRPREPGSVQPSSDVLRARFAHGEIDEDEYLRRRSALARSHRDQGGQSS